MLTYEARIKMLTSLVPYVVFVEVISGGARREHGWYDGNILQKT